jgi:hypothetical protein
MRKRLIPLIALLMILAVVAAAYSVAISLGSTDIDQLGATDKVEVYCPADPCSISGVKWEIAGPPYQVDQVKVDWTPRSSSGSYTVYVELYGSAGDTPLAYGSAIQPGSSGSVTTTVDVNPNADPHDVYYVRIVIVQV